MYSKTEKRQLLIFTAVCYGIPYLMGLLLWYGVSKELNVSAFASGQMLYPAAGVCLACLLTGRGERLLPKAFYISYVIVTAASGAVTAMSVLMPGLIVTLPGGLQMYVWLMLSQLIPIVGGLICFICILAAGKESRGAYGLRGKNAKASVFCVAVFILLYFGRLALSLGAAGEIRYLGELFAEPATWITAAILPLNFLLSYIVFFGEEYGWRYWLQPLLQKRFGLRGGVLFLGVVWGLWHLPLDFFFYVTPDKGLIQTTAQIITCVTLGIFMAWAYLKTENIWVPVTIHFLNNNLAVLLMGGGAESLQNQEVSWSMIPGALVVNSLFFGGFLLSGQFRKKSRNP